MPRITIVFEIDPDDYDPDDPTGLTEAAHIHLYEFAGAIGEIVVVQAGDARAF